MRLLPTSLLLLLPPPLPSGGVVFSATRPQPAAADDDELWLLRALRARLLASAPHPTSVAASAPERPAAVEEGAAAPLFSWARPQPGDGVAADVAARILAVLRDAGFGSRVRDVWRE